jgi:hypothetical protein
VSRHFTRTDTSVSAPPPTALHFTVLLSATRKGARLARLLATERLHAWGLPHDTAALVPGENGHGLLLIEELADRWGVVPELICPMPATLW